MERKSIFISHISQEAELANCIKTFLHKHFLGLLDIFVSSDRESILAGAKWLDEVDKALKEAHFLIILCSKESVGRPWVNFEAGAAWIRGIPVIPVCHSGIEPNDLPNPLVMLQGLKGSDENGLKKLYNSISKELEINSPEIDFKAMATEIAAIENRYIKEFREFEVIKNPRILCAATNQYMAPNLGFHLDVGVLNKTFPGCITVEEGLTKSKLFKLLANQKFDILHLVMGVDRDNGDLVFSEINHLTQKPQPGDKEVLSADGFATLLVEAGVKLVVLATCNALLLAVEVARYANMAASDTDITGEQAEKWENCFYGLLAQGKPLYKAFDLTKAQLEEIPIRAIRQKNLAFSIDEN